MEERPTIINRVRSSNTLRTRARARASDILQIALLLSLVALKDQPNTVGQVLLRYFPLLSTGRRVREIAAHQLRGPLELYFFNQALKKHGIATLGRQICLLTNRAIISL